MRFFISFSDGQAVHHEAEISREAYSAFLGFTKQERNLRRWDERHIEKTEQTENTLHDRARHPSQSVEETILTDIRNEKLREGIQCLPTTQRRRLVLYYDYGLTYKQIAEIEGCSFQVVAKAIKAAERTLRNFYENQG